LRSGSALRRALAQRSPHAPDAASINPTYNYGKRGSDAAAEREVVSFTKAHHREAAASWGGSSVWHRGCAGVKWMPCHRRRASARSLEGAAASSRCACLRARTGDSLESRKPLHPLSPRRSMPTPQALRAVHAQKVASGRGDDRTASGRTVSGQPTIAGQAHGHKGSLLFRPLPGVPAGAQAK
jgi:hypothetical protein